MIRKCFVVFLAGLLLQIMCVQPVAASSKTEKQTQLIEKVKAGILKLGVGQDARVEVKLRDKTTLSGYITEATSESFVITDKKTGATSTVPYDDVKQVKGHNLSTGAKIAIGIGIGVGICVIALAILAAAWRD